MKKIAATLVTAAVLAFGAPAAAQAAPAVRLAPTSIARPVNWWEGTLHAVGCMRFRAWYCSGVGGSGGW